METQKVVRHLMVAAIALAASAVSATPAIWNHVPAGDPIGVPSWGTLETSFGTCGTAAYGAVGKKQSPVNIKTRSTVGSPLPALSFHYRNTAAVVEDTGHVVEVPYEPGSYIRIGSEAQDVYELKQFHFHTPSEHAINGQLAAAEVHLVHANELGDLTVVGILLKVGSPVNTTVDKILRAEFPHGHHEVDLGGLVNAKNIIPQRRGYYHYSGSLTTPPCSEGVRWFVLKRSINVSQEAIDNLKSTVGHFPNYHGFQQNNRPVTPLNDRAILRDE